MTELESTDAQNDEEGFLEGKMLIAMPSIGDERFDRTVIYVCVHSAEGAMGIIVNKRAPNISFPDLLDQLDIEVPDSSPSIFRQVSDIVVLAGGPVETGRGFVLHSHDYFSDEATLPVSEEIGLTATLDILKAIAHGKGPSKAILALGYAGWAPGQLESEVRNNGWLHCEADAELVFGHDLDSKYQRCLQKLGIDLSMLSGDAGHA